MASDEGRGLAPRIHWEPPASPRRRVPAQVPRPTGAQDLAWLEDTPDLGLALVPGLCQDHGRRAGHWRTANLPTSPSLRQPSAPGTLRTRPGMPLQARPASPSTPEEAWIRCYQEPPSQQGTLGGRWILWLAGKDAPPLGLGTKPKASFQSPSGFASWRLLCLLWPFSSPLAMERGDRFY